MTGHYNVVDFNMLKTMETETKKWSRSPTRVANYRALTGKILVFSNRWSHKQVRRNIPVIIDEQSSTKISFPCGV